MKRFFAIAVIIVIAVSLQCCKALQVDVNKIDGAVITLDGEQGWAPDENVINEFEEKLIPYIYNFKSREGDVTYCNEDSLEFVKKNINRYKRQYIGKLIDGRKVLFCNFLLIDEEDDYLSDWKTNYHMIFDGGPRYFHVNYDVENKTFSDFFINGYA